MRLSQRLVTGLVTFLIWALAAATLVYWLLAMGGADVVSAPVAGRSAAQLTIDTERVARALGATEATQSERTAAASEIRERVALQGVLTQGDAGAVVVVVDGRPARTIRVGSGIEGLDGDWRLHSVFPHAAVFASGQGRARLEMPAMDQRSSAGDVVAPILRSVPQASAGSREGEDEANRAGGALVPVPAD